MIMLLPLTSGMGWDAASDAVDKDAAGLLMILYLQHILLFWLLMLLLLH